MKMLGCAWPLVAGLATGSLLHARGEAQVAPDLLRQAPQLGAPASDGAQADPERALADLPLAFVANRGQWADPVHFRVQAGPLDVWCESAGWTVVVERPDVGRDGLPLDTTKGVALGLRFEGADPRALPDGRLRQGGRHHWLRGSDPEAWITDVPSYERLRWRELYAGVDVVLRGGPDGLLEYDLHLQPGADLAQVVLRADGAEGLELTDSGDLLVHTALGPLRQSAPETFAVDDDGALQPVPCRFVLRGDGRFGFAVPEAYATRRLWIDPVLEWGTFLGGAHSDGALDVIVDDADRVTVVGFTQASDYPATTGAFDGSWNGSRDGTVTRLAADGSGLVFSTVIGGSADDEVTAVTLAPDGGVAVAGWTSSVNFPTSAGAFDASFGGGQGVLQNDAFVACLDATGGQLVLSSYLGGAGDDHAFDVALGADGALHVVGKTASADFPASAGAFDTTFGGGTADVGDAFVASFEPDGSALRWASYLGGASDELANAIVHEPDGSIVLAGWTGSSDFPVGGNAFQGSMGGTSDGFIVRMAPDGSAVSAGTLLGGASDENILALGLDDDGLIVAAGTTRSFDFPTTGGAPQSSYAGGVWFGDVFVVRLDADLEGLDLASYLGGAGDDVPGAVSMLADNRVLLAGWTTSADWPLAGELVDDALGGSTDAFFAMLDLDASQIVQSTYMGGSALDKATTFALAETGEIVLAGFTTSSDFDVTGGAWDTTFGGFPNLITDAFTHRLDAGLVVASSQDWTDLGMGHAGTAGVEPTLSATGSLEVGGDGGLLLLRDALPGAWAQLALGFDAGYIPLRGGTLVPWPLVAVLGFTTDPLGSADMPYAAAAPGTEGLSFFVQVWIQDPGASQGWASTNGLEALVP